VAGAFGAGFGALSHPHLRRPLFAWFFARCGARNEERGNRELRRELLAGLSGRVLEVGAGTGLNFPHYPAGVAEVVAVEPEPYLRGRAGSAAAAAPVPVRVVNGAARVLRAGGQLRFYEHVRSRDTLFSRVQRTADLVWPHLMGGCHVQRETRAAIGQVLTIEACRGFRFPPTAILSPVAPRILGTARKVVRAGRAG